MVHKVFSRLGGKTVCMMWGPNPKLITRGTALGAHTNRYTALYPSSRLISIPCYPVNEVESNHISQALGICYKTFSLLYISTIIPNWQDREL